MKWNIEVGEEFPLDANVIEAKTRGRIALIILVGVAVALSIAVAIGMRDGTFNELNCVWTAANPLIGIVVGYCLGRKNE